MLTHAQHARAHERTSFPMWKYAVIGGLLVLANFMNYAGARGTYLTGPVVVLLQQVCDV